MWPCRRIPFLFNQSIEQMRRIGARGGKPRTCFRLMLRRVDRVPGLEGATCRRTLCSDGTVSESVLLGLSRDGHVLTDAELDAWVATFPIKAPDGVIRPRRLPPP